MYKDLAKLKEKSLADLNAPVQEAQKLLAWEDQEAQRMLQKMSPRAVPSMVADDMGRKLTMDNLDAAYHGDVFTSEQIQKLAMKYNLRFLKTRDYRGNFDKEITDKLQEFAKLTNTTITEGNLTANFYILAATELFIGDNNHKDKRIMYNGWNSMLFYSIPTVGNSYRLVHTWGKNAGFFRVINGMFHRNANTRVFLLAASILFCIGMIDYMFLGWSLWWYIGYAVLSLVLALAFSPIEEGDKTTRFYAETGWDKLPRKEY